jgi:uncharacterized cupin superfamily protein
MRRSTIQFIAFFICGLVVGFAMLRHTPPALAAQTPTPSHAPVKIVHFFTGADGQTHFDEIITDTGNGVKLLPVTSAELHHGAPGSVTVPHVAPHRQYVITLSGHGELESSDGKKVEVGPGTVEFAEDLTGKGHITRTIGNEDRVTLWLQLADQTAPAPSK